MMIQKVGIVAAAICVALSSCAQKGFKKSKTGMEYNIVKDVSGSKKAVVGSMITMHIRTKVGDSIIFDSYKMNNNEPVPAEVAKPSFNGDIMEGLAMLTAGDSAIFQVSPDSLFRNGQPKPPFIKATDKVQFTVKMVTVQTADEYKKEKMEAASKQNAAEAGILTDYLTKNNLKAIKTESGLYYVITQEGTGALPQTGQKVTMNYSGFLLDGTGFDSNVNPKFGHVEPFEFPLGQHSVIAGWDEGIALLKIGTKAKLIIPSSLAYGAQSMPGNQNNPKGIPANSPLMFEVEVVGAK
jgi:FKBP-type peptidyl-prolyl cis-trans isomerase